MMQDFSLIFLLFASAAQALPAAQAPVETTASPLTTDTPSPTAAESTAPKVTQSFVSTWTGVMGDVEGCTDTACATGVPISTVPSIASSWYSRTHVTTAPWQTSVTKPATGCATVTMTDGTDNFCYCADGMIKGLQLGISSTTSTTVCSGAMPTGFKSVPMPGKSSPKWANPPTDDACKTGKVLDASCWEKLDMSNYVTAWWNTFNTTCEGQPFSECFYFSATKYSPSKCSILNSNPACALPKWDDFEDQWNGIRNFYVAWNIWKVNQFFLNYYTAIGLAQTTATDRLGGIVTLIDPIKKTNVGLNDVLTALSTGLAFLGPSNVVVKLFLTAVTQTAAVSKYVFPIGTTNKQVQDWNTISDSFAGVVTDLQNNLASALTATETDVNNFRSIVGSGLFSSEDTLPALNDMKNSAVLGFTTYMVSQAYQSRGTFLTRALMTDVDAMQNNGTDLHFSTGCGKGYDKYGTCDTFWFDKTTTTTYGLVNGGEKKQNFASDMQKLFDNNYTTPEYLFRNADQCTQASGTQGVPGKNPIANLQGKPSDFACVSNLPTCTWSLTVDKSHNTFFTDCDYTKMVTDNSLCLPMGNVPIGTDFKGPHAYLGWTMLNPSLKKQSAPGLYSCRA